jgi:CarD family transcriptional regulator
MKAGEILNMKFDIGDRVVHPQHGVGYVAELEEREFEPNFSRMYYVIAIPDTTVWVPVDLTTSGLRRLSMKSELEQCRLVLQSEPQPLKPDRGLLSKLSGRINQGTVIAHCEVVRDLTAFGWRKPLYGPPAEFKRNILNVLSQEWAVVEDVSQTEALHEIGTLLKKGRTAHEQ